MLSVALALSPSADAAIILNELLADPGGVNDANCDRSISNSQDEFVELVNTGPAPLELAGWTIRDATAVRHTFPVGSVLPAGRAMVVYGGGTASCARANVVYQLASTGTLSLGDGGDTVEIQDPNGVAVASYTYGSEGGYGESLTLAPDLHRGYMETHYTASANGIGYSYRNMSPGTRIDLSPFAPAPGATALAPANPGTAGVRNTWTLTGGEPNTSYVLVGSLTLGATLNPACPDDPLATSAPQVVAQATTDAAGQASFRAVVPAALAGRTVYLQAGSPAACDLSTLQAQAF